MRRITRRPRMLPMLKHASNLLPDIATGLDAAEMLAQNFPDFWAEHVAHRPVTSTSIVQVGAALIGLASQHVELSDWYLERAGWLADNDPHEIMAADEETLRTNLKNLEEYTEESAMGLIEEFVAQPPVQVYGVYLATEDYIFGTGSSLAMVLLWITMLAPFGDDDLLRLLDHPAFNNAIECELPRIDCNELERLERLCTELNRCEPSWNDTGIGLGQFLAYANGRTGNDFADTHPDEFLEMQLHAGVISWERGLPTIAQEQREARALADAFFQSEQQIKHAGSAHLITIAERIAMAASTLDIPVTWPASYVG